MPQEQQASIIEWVKPEVLKPHPLNLAIYGTDQWQDLVSSIRELGVMQALYVTPNNIIISGHRRWFAAQEVKLTLVPIIRVKYGTRLEERRAIIEHNRYRVKNGLQLYNEGKELEAIEVERAKERMVAGKTLDPVDNLPQGKTRDIIAKTIGLGSGKQWDKLKFVAEKKPELLPATYKTRTLNSAFTEVKRQEKRHDIETKTLEELLGKYNVFLADPPWQYDNESTSLLGMAETHYQTMRLPDIMALPIQDHCLDDAVIFLWATTAMLHKALHLLEAWGFEFKTSMVWVKNRIGTGFFVRSKHEYILIGTRGTFLPMTTQLPESVFFAEKTAHSQKPEELYTIIETMYPKQRYVELFARNISKRPNWTYWGNEAKG